MQCEEMLRLLKRYSDKIWGHYIEYVKLIIEGDGEGRLVRYGKDREKKDFYFKNFKDLKKYIEAALQRMSR